MDRNKSSVDHKINCSIVNDDIKSCVDQNINSDISVPIKEKINQVTLNTDDECKTTDTEKKELAQGCAILYCNILELPITYCNTFMTAINYCNILQLSLIHI